MHQATTKNLQAKNIISVLIISLILYFINVREIANRELRKLMLKISKNAKRISEQKKLIQDSYDTVKLLGKIGQKITAEISLEQIIQTSFSEISKIITIGSLNLGIVDKEKHIINFYRPKNKGEYEFSIARECKSDKDFPSIRCFDNQEIIYIENYPEIYKNTKYDDKSVGSELFIPLGLEGNKLGVMSVTNLKISGFDSQHQDILLNISVYVSIALINAESFDKIEAQKKEIVFTNTQLSQQKEELTQTLELVSEQKDEISQTLYTINQQKEELIQTLETVSEQKDELTKNNEEITRSINYASRIQNAILPSNKYMSNILKEYFILYYPRDIVSGDFYKASLIGNKFFHYRRFYFSIIGRRKQYLDIGKKTGLTV